MFKGIFKSSPAAVVDGSPTQVRMDANGNILVAPASGAAALFPAAAALADNSANPTTTRIGACLTLFDAGGANWDLARCQVVAPGTPFGFLNVLPCGTYNATDLAATDTQSLPLQQELNGRLKTNGYASDLCVTNTGTSGNAVTATLPSVTSKFHYITQIVIQRFAVAALTAAATPVIVTTTNLPGTLAFSVDASAAAQGTIDKQEIRLPGAGMKSSAAATNTTIVAPATTNVIWRVTAYYYAAP